MAKYRVVCLAARDEWQWNLCKITELNKVNKDSRLYTFKKLAWCLNKMLYRCVGTKESFMNEGIKEKEFIVIKRRHLVYVGLIDLALAYKRGWEFERMSKCMTWI